MKHRVHNRDPVTKNEFNILLHVTIASDF